MALFPWPKGLWRSHSPPRTQDFQNGCRNRLGNNDHCVSASRGLRRYCHGAFPTPDQARSSAAVNRRQRRPCPRRQTTPDFIASIEIHKSKAFHRYHEKHEHRYEGYRVQGCGWTCLKSLWVCQLRNTQTCVSCVIEELSFSMMSGLETGLTPTVLAF